jgi:FixJ family two-component response regulator
MHLNQVKNGKFKVRNYQKDKRLNSKIPDDAIPYILKWVEKGVTNKYIAKMFKTSDMAISRIRKRYMKQMEEEAVTS